MNRRTLLKQLTMAVTAAVLLPSCVKDSKKISIALNNLDVNGDEEELLAAIVDTIIPATDKPGAKAVGAHHFALIMVNDCTDQPARELFMKGLLGFENTCKTVKGKTFMDSSAEERLVLLQHFEKNQESLGEEINGFYYGMRYLTIEAYTNSEYFLTEVKPYQLVPGPDFKGCVSVSSTAQNV